MAQTLWETVWLLLTNEGKNYYGIRQSRLWYTPKIIESRVSERYLHICVHSNVIPNSQEAEATQVSTDG